jgi:hypothetical protein
MVPLDWNMVKEKYKPGTKVRHIVGSRAFEILRVTEEAIYFKWGAVPEGAIHRSHLERIVELIEEGVVRPDQVTLTSDYRTLVSDERPTTAIGVLKDLGYVR